MKNGSILKIVLFHKFLYLNKLLFLKLKFAIRARE
jgi:hypothetical protein